MKITSKEINTTFTILLTTYLFKGTVLDRTEFVFGSPLFFWILNTSRAAKENNLTARILKIKWDVNKFIQFSPDFS